MGQRLCPHCNKVVETRVLGGYSQKKVNGIVAKCRKIIHRTEDGGCGCEWETYEIPVEMMAMVNEEGGNTWYTHEGPVEMMAVVNDEKLE